VGALFRSVRRTHINHVCEHVCFHRLWWPWGARFFTQAVAGACLTDM
jgi:hypothetical protein